MNYMECTHYGAAIIFFFQAEDGIRDVAVTGVQTCALPISVHLREILVSAAFAESRGRLPLALGKDVTGLPVVADLTAMPRSEERRVGKECRSRWSPYH